MKRPRPFLLKADGALFNRSATLPENWEDAVFTSIDKGPLEIVDQDPFGGVLTIEYITALINRIKANRSQIGVITNNTEHAMSFYCHSVALSEQAEGMEHGDGTPEKPFTNLNFALRFASCMLRAFCYRYKAVIHLSGTVDYDVSYDYDSSHTSGISFRNCLIIDGLKEDETKTVVSSGFNINSALIKNIIFDFPSDYRGRGIGYISSLFSNCEFYGKFYKLRGNLLHCIVDSNNEHYDCEVECNICAYTEIRNISTVYPTYRNSYYEITGLFVHSKINCSSISKFYLFDCELTVEYRADYTAFLSSVIDGGDDYLHDSHLKESRVLFCEDCDISRINLGSMSYPNRQCNGYRIANPSSVVRNCKFINLALNLSAGLFENNTGTVSGIYATKCFDNNVNSFGRIDIPPIDGECIGNTFLFISRVNQYAGANFQCFGVEEYSAHVASCYNCQITGNSITLLCPDDPCYSVEIIPLSTYSKYVFDEPNTVIRGNTISFSKNISYGNIDPHTEMVRIGFGAEGFPVGAFTANYNVTYPEVDRSFYDFIISHQEYYDESNCYISGRKYYRSVRSYRGWNTKEEWVYNGTTATYSYTDYDDSRNNYTRTYPVCE